MKKYVQARVRWFALGLVVLFLLVIGGYAWLGVETNRVDDLTNLVNNRPRPPICARVPKDGQNGTIGLPGLNGTCDSGTCVNGTDGLLEVTITSADGTVLSTFFATDANLTIIVADNDTVVELVGPQGPPGANGTNGVNGSTGPAGAPGTNGTNGSNGTQGAAGSNGTCTTPCTNGTNGAAGSAGANGVVQVTALGCNGSQAVEFNATNPFLTIFVSDNFTFVSLSGQNGTAGANGVNGTNGANGTSCVPCTNGTNGVNGVNGTNGRDGVNGTSGTGCTNRIGLGSLISAPGTTTALSSNIDAPLNGMTTSGAMRNFTRVVSTLEYTGTDATQVLLVANIGFSYSVTSVVYVAIYRNATLLVYGGPVSVAAGASGSVGASCTSDAVTGDSFKIYARSTVTGTITNTRSSLSAITL
jgi:hypothetical protein